MGRKHKAEKPEERAFYAVKALRRKLSQMTTAEQEAEIARLGDDLFASAPTLAAAQGDALALLMLAAAAFSTSAVLPTSPAPITGTPTRR